MSIRYQTVDECQNVSLRAPIRLADRDGRVFQHDIWSVWDNIELERLRFLSQVSKSVIFHNYLIKKKYIFFGLLLIKLDTVKTKGWHFIC